VVETIELLHIIEHCGVSAIAIHGRNVKERPKDAAHWEVFDELKNSNSLSVPLICNGDVWSYNDFHKLKQQTGCSSVMTARGAIANCSIFSENQKPHRDVVLEYMKHSLECKNVFQNTKYTILRMHTTSDVGLKTDEGKQLQSSKSIMEISKILGLEEYYLQLKKSRKERKNYVNKTDLDEPDINPNKQSAHTTKPAHDNARCVKKRRIEES